MMTTKAELVAGLKTRAAALGLSVQDRGADGLAGEVKSIRAKWFLGARSVFYRMACRLAEAEHTVHYRESITESSWGLPPPTFSVEKTTTSGWQRSGARTDVSVGGGGTVDYGQAREAFRQTVADAGWQFHFEGGRMP